MTIYNEFTNYANLPVAACPSIVLGLASLGVLYAAQASDPARVRERIVSAPGMTSTLLDRRLGLAVTLTVAATTIGR